MESRENGHPESNILENDDVFMLDGVCYKVTGYNSENKRFFAEATDSAKVNLEKNELINIKNQWYRIYYIHKTKNRITFIKN
jgi:hypothetical protein